MADEAVLVFRQEEPIGFTCADGTGIEYGAVLKNTTPMTAIITSADADKLAGICAREKVASDGRTAVAVYRRGIFRMVASGTITTGDAVMSGATTVVNRVKKMTAGAGLFGSVCLGTALSDATDGNTVMVAVNVGAGGNQVS